jgi:hypothetical protein
MTVTTPLLLEHHRGSCAVHLLLTQGEIRVLAEDPQRMEEEFLLRATKMSQVLEEILRHSHRETHWGINE